MWVATHFHMYYVKKLYFWSQRSFLISEDNSQIYLSISIDPKKVFNLYLWHCNGYPSNVRFGIEELINESDIILLVETWVHDIQRIQGLGELEYTFLNMGEKYETTRGLEGWHVCGSIIKYDAYMT